MSRRVKNKEEYIKYAEKHTFKETAKKFNLPVKTVAMRKFKWGIGFKNEKQKYDGKKLSDYAKTHSIAETARHFNIPYKSTWHAVKRYQETKRKSKMDIMIAKAQKLGYKGVADFITKEGKQNLYKLK